MNEKREGNTDKMEIAKLVPFCQIFEAKIGYYKCKINIF